MTNVVSRRKFLAGLYATSAAVLLASCQAAPTAAPQPTAPPVAAQPTAAPAQPTAAPQPAAGGPKRGGAAIAVATNLYVSMDPILASGPTAEPCYDGLLEWRPDENGIFSPQPGLAESWEAEGTKIVLHLRKGVKFHDGSDLNADVVVWNLSRMVQDDHSFARSYLARVDKEDPATALDDMTVQINLTQPSGGVLANLCGSNLYIVSKKAAEEHGEDWLQLNPVGTGPFKIVSWEPGDRLVAERNPDYWRMGADGQPLPYLDRITTRVIIESTTQLNELRAGTADYMANIPGRDVQAARNLSGATYVVDLNQGLKRQFFFNAQKGPFVDNKPLRLAVQYAIDRVSMAKALGGDLGSAHPWEFVPGEIGFNPDVPHYEYDLEKAKEYVKESGLSTPVDVRMVVHSREMDQQQAQIMQAMLDKIGIKLNLDIVERVAWGEKVRIQNDFEMATRQTGPSVDMAAGLIVTWVPEGYSAYHRAVVPGLMEKLAEADAEYDTAKRQKFLEEAQVLMHDSCWFGYMWYESGNRLMNNRLKGVPDYLWGPLRSEEWWIDE